LIKFSFFDDPISTAQLILPLIEHEDDADNNWTIIRKEGLSLVFGYTNNIFA
jgi:hypothetical protein